MHFVIWKTPGDLFIVKAKANTPSVIGVIGNALMTSFLLIHVVSLRNPIKHAFIDWRIINEVV